MLKRFFYSAMFCFSSVQAQEVDLQEDRVAFPQTGIYIGVGLSAANDRGDFSLNCCPDGGNYAVTEYCKSKRNYNNQIFVGYRIFTPVFAAVELSYALNKTNIEKRYDYFELPGGPVLGHTANLSVKYGNELALKLKVGRMFSIFAGDRIRHVSIYGVVGLNRRDIEVNFDYIPPSPQAAVNVDDFSFANHKMKAPKLGFIWGLGSFLALENNWSVGFEYNRWQKRSAHDQRTLLTPAWLGNNLDQPDCPRYYTLNGKGVNSFAFWLSKTLSFGR